MTTYQKVKELNRLDTLKDDNKALNILNDIFSVWEFNTTNYKTTTIQGVLKGSRKSRLYVIANNILLQINDNYKPYNYFFNGNAGKNMKQVIKLDLPFSRNATLKLIDILN